MRRPRIAVLLLLLIIVSVAWGADPWKRHLPPEWLGVLVVRDLPAFDQQAERVAKMFALDAPGLTRLREAAGLNEVTDAEGSWLVGLARGPQGREQSYPFAMIPIRDFGALVDALDGGMQGHFAVVTLAEQDLLAGDCGSWALLMNPTEREIFDSVLQRAVDANTGVEQRATTDGVAGVHVSKLGLQSLADYAPEVDATPKGASARRKRGIAIFSRDGLRESLVFDKPLWQWLATEFNEATLSVDFDDVGGAKVRVRGAKPQAAEGEISEPSALVEWSFGNRPWISFGGVQLSREMIALAAGGYLALLQSRTDDLGVERFDGTELLAFKKSIESVLGQVSTAHFATLADDQLPVFGNRIVVLHVVEPGQFLQACDELVQRWNALIVASQAEVELNFTSEAIEIAGRSGRRYFVDMVEAVDVPRSPEVTKTMSDMFGPQGILNWYVVPLGSDRVLLENVPVGEVEKLVVELVGEGAKPQAGEGRGWLRFDASRYVDWTKRRDRALLGDVVGGPRFVPLSKSAPLDATLQVREGVVEMELTFPQILLETLGKHAQETR